MKYNRTNLTNHLLLFLKILLHAAWNKMQHNLPTAYSIFTSSSNWIFFWNLHFQFFLYLKIEYTSFLYLKRRDSLCYNQFSKKKLMAEFVDVKQLHGFMQAILTFGRCYKRLNLPIEF